MSLPVAADGMDVVSYRTAGGPQEGSGAHTAEWDGRQWQFASAGNRDVFVSRPEHYAPQYGGQCAFAVSLGKEGPGSPRTWTVRDDRLFFLLNPVVRVLFSVLPGRVAAADARWRAGAGGD